MSDPVIIGDATLYCGDAREILPTLGPIDACITDPPYGISLVPQRGLTESIQGDGRNEAKELWAFAAEQIARIAREDTAHIFWTGWSEVWTKELLERHFTVKSCVVWAKNMWGIGYYTRPQHEMAWYCHKGRPPVPEIPDSDLWQVPRIQAPVHSCEKPVSLFARAVRLCTPSQQTTVVDPFMGVGGAGVAAVKAGRRFIGIEINDKYFDIACTRIEQSLLQPDFFVESPSVPRQELLDV